MLCPAPGNLSERVWCMAECPSCSSLRLHMDNDTVHVTIGLRLGSPLAAPTPVTTTVVCKLMELPRMLLSTTLSTAQCLEPICLQAGTNWSLPLRWQMPRWSHTGTLGSGRLLEWDATCPDRHICLLPPTIATREAWGSGSPG